MISCTTQERAFCRLVEGGDAIVIENDGLIGVVKGPEDLALQGDKLDIVRAALTYFSVRPREASFHLSVTTQLPMQAGLAGSTAMLTAIVGALTTWLGLKFHLYSLAEMVRKIEADILGVLCGFQDQHMAVFGGLNFMDFLGKEALEQRPDEPLATIEPLAERLLIQPTFLLAHTGVQHHSGTVHKTPRERWLEGDPMVHESYIRIATLARRGKRALIEGDWELLGHLMNSNHAIVAALGGSHDENDRLIEAARAAGAWGAKLAGAGGGGTIIALVDDVEKVGAALYQAGAERLLTPTPAPGLTVQIGS